MALGVAVAGEHNWRGALSAIKAASSDFENISGNPVRLRDFVKLLCACKQHYSSSQEVMREIHFQTDKLKNSCLQPHLFDNSLLDITHENGMR